MQLKTKHWRVIQTRFAIQKIDSSFANQYGLNIWLELKARFRF